MRKLQSIFVFFRKMKSRPVVEDIVSEAPSVLRLLTWPPLSSSLPFQCEEKVPTTAIKTIYVQNKVSSLDREYIASQCMDIHRNPNRYP